MIILKRFYIYILLFFVFLLISAKILLAQSVSTVNGYNSQINQDNQKIQQLQQQETALKNSMNSQISNKNSILSNLYNINSNIYTYENNIGKIRTLIANLDSLNIKNQQKVKKDIKIKNKIENSIYINLQINPLYYIISSADFNKAIVNIYLNLSQFSSYKSKILAINKEINSINVNLSKQKNFESQLVVEENSLKPIQESLYSKLNSTNNAINNTNNSINQVGGKISSLQQDIQKLNNLEALAQAKASSQNNAAPPPEVNNPKPASSANTSPNTFQFTSYGFGNPMGMSQYGMLGMAQKGYNYSQIATNYYQGSSLSTISNLDNTTVNVPGYGNMTLQHYLAGIGEVINSWPKQAIEAQIVISRSYVLFYLDHCSDYSSCTPTMPTSTNIPSTGPSFQQYDGGTAKMSAVVATENQVLTYNGSLINAFFSSSNGGYEDSIGTVECVLWNNCNYNSFLSNYLKGKVDQFDTPSIDPNYQYTNPPMNTIQLINIVNTAQALCAGVSSCYLFNNNNGSSSFDNAYSTDNSNTNSNNATNDTFTNINKFLTSNGISPINSITNFSISTMGQMPYKINVKSLHHNITINAGVFWLAFLLVSPNYSNFNDDLVGFRYTVSIQ